MYEPCYFLYEVSYEITLVQPDFDFRQYPNDDQDITVRLTVMNYDAADVQLFPLAITCSFLPDDSCTFSHNAIWSWNEDADSCTTYEDPKYSMIWPNYASYTINVERSAGGILIRFVVPLTLLILLSALTFWITYENRVDTTITLLLAISALYIVILQNIPMVGYLTNVDRFVFGVSIVCSLDLYRTDRNAFVCRCFYCCVLWQQCIKYMQHYVIRSIDGLCVLSTFVLLNLLDAAAFFPL